MSGPIPKTWMPNVSMKRIHLHWTAGGHKANSTDKKAYHVLVEGSGKMVRGKFSIADNVNPKPGKYAAHTARANTGAIGVSMCCMAGARERPFNAGSSPMTEEQWDTAIAAIAQLARKYNILVTDETILTHAEVWPTLNIRQKNKWDVTRLAFNDKVQGHRDVRDLVPFVRQEHRQGGLGGPGHADQDDVGLLEHPGFLAVVRLHGERLGELISRRHQLREVGFLELDHDLTAGVQDA